ncbi:MAG: hypothetical protein NUV61_01110 [Candidatus Azambacteria bacterium]|nr:hypothetical protein [Candidatus Azambacteria bacterium]
MEHLHKKQIIGIIVFGVVVIALGFLVSAILKQRKAEQPSGQPATEQEQQTATAKLLATDPADPSHINNIKYIREGLEKYYNDKKMYPKNLDELVPTYARILPKYSSSRDYFYAYYPEAKPTAYHIGTLLGGRNQASPQAFATDADLNSEKAGYIGGFNGADPIYDIKGGK